MATFLRQFSREQAPLAPDARVPPCQHVGGRRCGEMGKPAGRYTPGLCPHSCFTSTGTCGHLRDTIVGSCSFSGLLMMGYYDVTVLLWFYSRCVTLTQTWEVMTVLGSSWSSFRSQSPKWLELLMMKLALFLAFIQLEVQCTCVWGWVGAGPLLFIGDPNTIIDPRISLVLKAVSYLTIIMNKPKELWVAFTKRWKGY